MEEAINDDDFHPDLTAGSLACAGRMFTVGSNFPIKFELITNEEASTDAALPVSRCAESQRWAAGHSQVLVLQSRPPRQPRFREQRPTAIRKVAWRR